MGKPWKTCETPGHHLKLGEGHILGSGLNTSQHISTCLNMSQLISMIADSMISIRYCTVVPTNSSRRLVLNESTKRKHEVWYTLGHYSVSLPSQSESSNSCMLLNMIIWCLTMFDSFHFVPFDPRCESFGIASIARPPPTQPPPRRGIAIGSTRCQLYKQTVQQTSTLWQHPVTICNTKRCKMMQIFE